MTKQRTANSKFALCGQNRKFGVRFFYEHLSWQTNPSPKTRTAQTCGTLAVRRNLFIDSCKPDRKFLQDSENRKDKINTAAIKL